jgi:ATP-dependent helicase HepA
MTFSPGQRVISLSEPDLGLGTVTGADLRYVEVTFQTNQTTRKYAAKSAPLKRIVFKAGDIIKDTQGKSFRVQSIEGTPESGLIIYQCDSGPLSEESIADTVSMSTPEQRLLNGICDGIDDFDFRTELLHYQARIFQSPVRGFAGGRIDLLPHQLFIAQEVSSRRIPRVLLADETGLGKTIEACLIAHRLLVNGTISRVLVLVPESLVHQWFVELLRRFNLTFRIIDDDYRASVSPETNLFLGDQLDICNIGFIAQDRELADKAVAAGWDLVIVDEAHHLQETSDGYRFVKRLAASCRGLLLLTATPEQLGRRDHFLRLQLLDPDRYSDFDSYERETARLHAVSRFIDAFLVENRIDLARVTPDQVAIPLTGEILAAFGIDTSGQEHNGAPSLTLAQILDRYGIGRAMIRNTRHQIAGFAAREVDRAPLTADDAVLARMRKEWQADNNPLAECPAIRSDDPRILWLLQLIKDRPQEKILVICSRKEKVPGIQAALQTATSIDIAVFHEDMTLIQRDRNAAWFAETPGARVLICSEIGSEGRNFQFCHNLVLFDLPRDPELLEQRIGRLDRIGQKSTIHIRIPYAAGSPQEILCRWYQDGLDAFSKNVPAAGRVHDAVAGRLNELLSARQPARSAIEDLITETRRLCEKFTERILASRDRLLEISSCQPHRSAALINEIRQWDQGYQTESIMQRLFKRYGILVEEAGTKTSVLITEYATDPRFPLPRKEKPVITYDRATALVRDDIEFMTLDHPLVTGSLDLHLSSDHGTTAFAIWNDRATKELLLEATFVVECLAPAHLNAFRFLPPTPVRVLLNHKGEDYSDRYSVSELRSKIVNAPVKRLLSNDAITQTVLPKMIESATALASRYAQPIITQAIGSMDKQLSEEIDRLRYLKQRNPAVSQKEIDRCSEEQDILRKHLSESRVRMDAIRVIWRGPA